MAGPINGLAPGTASSASKRISFFWGATAQLVIARIYFYGLWPSPCGFTEAVLEVLTGALGYVKEES